MMKPDKTDFMDSDMRNLWDTFSPDDLQGYRLYGGTALALYLDHRHSTDFDFFRQGPVEKRTLQTISWLQSADFTGEKGMVDARIPATNRDLIINFVSIDDFNAIPPTQPPVKAENRIDVAHPIDILANKLAALSNRKLYRDFFDIAFAHTQIPDALDEAIKLYLNDRMTNDSEPTDLAKTLINYSFQVEFTLPTHLSNSLNTLSTKLNRIGTKERFFRHLARTRREHNADHDLEL